MNHLRQAGRQNKRKHRGPRDTIADSHFVMARLTLTVLLLCAVTNLPAQRQAEDPWLLLPGADGPGQGKHIVLVSGDEEYRSEEGLPQLARILASHHGFTCTVLFAIDPSTGIIDPDNQNNIPGLAVLEDADLLIIMTRFRDLPDEQMRHLVTYTESGRPIIGLRTATHAFRIPKGKTYRRYSSGNVDWDGGFGRQVLGEDWVRHHGDHGKQSTRGLVSPGMTDHPIVRGCEDIWGPTDVYAVKLPMRDDCQALIMGQVLSGMAPDSEPVTGEQNAPLMPIAWTTSYRGASGETARIFTTTMGASQDLESEGLRRLIINAAYWALGMEAQIPARAKVDLVGSYAPTDFGFGGHEKGVKPGDLPR